MPEKTENVHSNATPHPDGEIENVINDPTATQSPNMGIYMKSDKKEQNPFHLSKVKNKDMEEFERLMKGDALDK